MFVIEAGFEPEPDFSHREEGDDDVSGKGADGGTPTHSGDGDEEEMAEDEGTEDDADVIDVWAEAGDGEDLLGIESAE